MRKIILCSLSLLAVLLLGCKTNTNISHPKSTGVKAQNAMVVTARQEASKIGVAILQQGGNAFDAMIATEMALAVSYPYAGSLGGGGFMVYRKTDGTTGALDYREKAPLAAHRDMFLDSLGQVVPERSQESALAVGVPGNIAGIFAVHQKFGTLPMQQLLKPVIDLAKKGYVVTKNQQKRLEKYRETFHRINQDTILYAGTYYANDTIKNPILATTLERIAKYGKKDFYQGETAKTLVSFLQKHGGIMTLEDLARYEPKWRDPIQFQYKEYTITSMSPPSSGGICLGQMFKMIEPYPISDYGHLKPKTIQTITEAARRAYADRSFYLGDPDFVHVPSDRLLDRNYLQKRMQDFSLAKATPSSTIKYGQLPGYESSETTHYSIVDAAGNAVSVTTTINGAYGSKLYVPELGFFLNNEMDDFSSKPGVPNMFGLIGAKANAIAPQKRMLSSMTPTLVEKKGQLYMVVGTPGGSTIITSVLQTILNVIEHDMSMQEAVDAPRFHHQWLPDLVFFEESYSNPQLFETLKNKGYKTSQKAAVISGKVDAILIQPDGTLEGGADHRGDDTAIGY